MFTSPIEVNVASVDTLTHGRPMTDLTSFTDAEAWRTVRVPPGTHETR